MRPKREKQGNGKRIRGVGVAKMFLSYRMSCCAFVLFLVIVYAFSIKNQ